MKKTVLIVDDSRIIRQQVKQALAEAGFEVIEAQDGLDGLEKLKAHPETVMMISDINMPRMNGLELIDQVKAGGQHAGLPIVVLTTEGHPEMIERARSAGAKGWIVKPFKSDLLVAAAKRLTGQAAPAK